jgi:hypothetical protein
MLHLTRLAVLAAGILVLVSGGGARCAASEQAGLDRPLIVGEALAWRVSDSPAIGVGRFISAYDTTVERGFNSGSAKFRVARFRAERWLRGDLRPGVLRVSWFRDDRFVIVGDPSNQPGWRGPTVPTPSARRVIALFRDMGADPTAPSATFAGALQRVSRWAGGDDSHDEAPQVLTWTPALEDTVLHEVAHQSPDSLLARAAVIVVADSLTGLPPPNVRVHEVLRGRGIGKFIAVRFVLSWLAYDRHPRLLLLARAPDGVLEPVSFNAGALWLEGARVPAWNCSLDDVRAKIARDDSRRAR